MTDALLAIIAVSVLTMAIIQVAAIVLTARAARKLGAVVERLEADLKPIVANLQSVSADAARTTAMAAATVERADRFIQDAAARIEQTLSSVPALLESAKEGFNVLGGLRAIITAFRELRAGSRRRPQIAEEEDALFIG